MGGLSTAVDVRDMLCAQALAVVAQAVKRLRLGDAMGIRFNAEDVRRDLVLWASEQGHAVAVEGPGTLRLQRRR